MNDQFKEGDTVTCIIPDRCSSSLIKGDNYTVMGYYHNPDHVDESYIKVHDSNNKQFCVRAYRFEPT